MISYLANFQIGSILKIDQGLINCFKTNQIIVIRTICHAVAANRSRAVEIGQQEPFFPHKLFNSLAMQVGSQYMCKGDYYTSTCVTVLHASTDFLWALFSKSNDLGLVSVFFKQKLICHELFASFSSVLSGMNIGRILLLFHFSRFERFACRRLRALSFQCRFISAYVHV